MYQAVLYLLLLAALSPVWWAAGQLAARFKAPRITGYILAGVASGPYALGALSAEGLEVLSPVDRLSLSLIALAAGAELQVAELRKIKRQVRASHSLWSAEHWRSWSIHTLHWKTHNLSLGNMQEPEPSPLQVTWITLGISGCTWVLVFPCALALASYLPFMAAVPPHTVTAMATLLATLAVARSPASAVRSAGLGMMRGTGLGAFVGVCNCILSLHVHALHVHECGLGVKSSSSWAGPVQIAVLKETEGKGPYCSLVMAVVVLKDVLVFVCFALNIELAKAVRASWAFCLARWLQRAVLLGCSHYGYTLARQQAAPRGKSNRSGYSFVGAGQQGGAVDEREPPARAAGEHHHLYNSGGSGWLRAERNAAAAAGGGAAEPYTPHAAPQRARQVRADSWVAVCAGRGTIERTP